MQRARDARALQRLLRAIGLADGHQAGHLGLGELDLLAAEGGERDVLDDVVGEGGHEGPLCGLRNGAARGPGRAPGQRWRPTSTTASGRQ